MLSVLYMCMNVERTNVCVVSSVHSNFFIDTLCCDAQVRQQVFDAGFLCDTDLDDSTTMNKKIRNAQLAQYNFIFGTQLYSPPHVCTRSLIVQLHSC